MLGLILIAIACLVLLAYWRWGQAARQWCLRQYRVRIQQVREDHRAVMGEMLPALRAFELAFLAGDQPLSDAVAVEENISLPARQAFELAFVRRRQCGVAGAEACGASPAQPPLRHLDG